ATTPAAPPPTPPPAPAAAPAAPARPQPAAAPAAAPAPPPACDQLAAPRFLPGTPGPGIDIAAVDGAAPPAASPAALAAVPRARRFRTYRARAHYRPGAMPAAAAAAQQAADAGDPYASHLLGVMTRDGQGGIRRDDARALQLLRRAADAGNAAAQADLAFMI